MNAVGFISVSSVGILILVAALSGGETGAPAPEHVPEAVIERLVLVWPRFDSMPERDQMILAGLADACLLSDGPRLREDTIACLRWAAAKAEPRRMGGLHMDDVQARLEAMLDEAEGA